jgi:hypothetical protein
MRALRLRKVRFLGLWLFRVFALMQHTYGRFVFSWYISLLYFQHRSQITKLDLVCPLRLLLDRIWTVVFRGFRIRSI